MKKLLVLLFALFSVQLYAQTETQEYDQQPADQTEQTTDQQTTQDEYSTPIDVPADNVEMADPSSGSSAGLQSSPGHSSGYGTETIRYYSGSHSGNNVTRTVEVPLPEGSTTQRGY